jgi:prevent-host-death family protein
METITASDAKREFGDVLLKAQSAPVTINKNGKPVAVVVSFTEYEQLEACKEAQLKAAIQIGIADIAAGRVASSEDVIKRLRNRIA